MAVVMLAGLTGVALAEEAHEHTYEPANDYKKEPTCTEYGFTPYVCSGCGDVKYEDIREPLGHDWDEGKVVVEPSAQTQGATGIAYTCTRCGEVMAEWVLPKTEGNTANGQTQTNEQQTVNDPTKPPVADKTADLEGAPIWERPFYYVTLTGDWATDLLSIANAATTLKRNGMKPQNLMIFTTIPAMVPGAGIRTENGVRCSFPSACTMPVFRRMYFLRI